jgi:hypothetical protein
MIPPRSFVSIAILSTLAACSAPPEPSADDTGVAQAAITQVPPQIACIAINVAGARTVERKFEVTAGQSSVLALTELPTGSVVFHGFAYAAACASVTASTTPAWLSDAVPATLIAGTPVNVTLPLRKNGVSNVGVDFQDDEPPVDAGAPQPLVTLSATSLDFGAVNCGTTATPQTLEVTNQSPGAVTITASLPAGSAYTVAPSPILLSAGGLLILKVTPPAVPQTAQAAASFDDTLTVTTSPSGPAYTIPLRQRSRGAQLVWEPDSLDFTQSLTPSKQATLRNTGNVTANVLIYNPSTTVTFPYSPPSAVLAPGGSLLVTVSRPSMVLTTGTLKTTTNDPICGAFPSLAIKL